MHPRGQTTGGRAYGGVWLQRGGTWKELDGQTSVLKRLTDGSGRSDANVVTGIGLRGPKMPPGPMQLLSPRPPTTPPFEEMYETEILPTPHLKNNSFEPQQLDPQQHGRS